MTEEEIKQAEHEKWENLFKPGNGEIIKSAKVMKRNWWYFYQDRKLTLTNEPRLMYFTGDEYRGDIKLTKDLKTEYISNDRFNLINTKSGTAKYFKVYSNDSAKQWCKLINKVLKYVKE